MVRDLGAERVIDHRSEDFAVDGPVYDLIIEVGGRYPIKRLRKALAARGRLVIFGGENGNMLTGGIGRHDLGFFTQTESAEQIERVLAHIETGAVAPTTSHTFGLAEGPVAMEALAAGKAAIVVR